MRNLRHKHALERVAKKGESVCLKSRCVHLPLSYTVYELPCKKVPDSARYWKLPCLILEAVTPP